MEQPLNPGAITEGSKSPVPNYEPTEFEQATIRMVEKLFGQAKKAKELHDVKWLEHYKFYRGKQWPEKRPSYRHSEVINLIFSEVQNVLVLMTDNRPDIEALPEDPTDLEFSEILSQILKAKWDNDLYAAVLAEAIVDAAIFGTAVGHVPWNPDKLDGLGDFTFETEDPFYFFPDPNAHSHLNDEYCEYVIRARPTALHKLKKKYPDKAEYLKADLQDLSTSYTDKENLDDVAYKSPTDNRVIIEADRSIKSGKPNQILELCLYLKSEEMIEEEIGNNQNPETGEVTAQYQQKLKYPTGRKVVIANGVLLEDGPNPYEDGKFPFATLVDNAIPRQLWGSGEVEQLRSAQMILNKLLSYTLDTMSLMGNPIWKVHTSNALETDNITNQPGLVIEYSGEKEPIREPGVPIPSYIMNLLEMMSENIWSKLASTTEVSKGVAPTENASGYAIAQLQEASQTRLRGKSRNVEYFLKQIGDLMISRILQFYTIPRVVRVTNRQEAAQYFKFHVEEIPQPDGSTQRVANVTQYMTDPITGQPALDQTRQIPLKSRIDVRINVGSSLPFAKIENRTLAEKLFDKGIIDAEEFLTQIDYPRKEKIVEKLNQKMAAEQAAGAMQNANPNAPRSSGPPSGAPATSSPSPAPR